MLFQGSYQGDIFKVTMSRCSCQQNEKNGIPCAHLIGLKRILRKPYEDTIEKRWKLQEDDG